MIAKFAIPNDKSFWGKDFHMIPKTSLYPNDDPIQALCEEIRVMAKQELKPGEMGEFLTKWADIEEWLVARANKFTQKYPSVLEAIRTLYKKEVLNDNQYFPLNQLRNFRNKLVHEPKRIEAEEVAHHMDLADDLLKTLRAIEP